MLKSWGRGYEANETITAKAQDRKQLNMHKVQMKLVWWETRKKDEKGRWNQRSWPNSLGFLLVAVRSHWRILNSGDMINMYLRKIMNQMKEQDKFNTSASSTGSWRNLLSQHPLCSTLPGFEEERLFPIVSNSRFLFQATYWILGQGSRGMERANWGLGW